MTTDASGNVVDQQYFAYGRKRGGGALPTDYTFTGQKQDAIGLLYFNARYYDPELGTFLSPDTLVPDPTNVFDYNRYMYTYGNPLRYNDPSGQFSQTQIEDYLKAKYPNHWRDYLAAWTSDSVFWQMLGAAEVGNTLYAPTSPYLAASGGLFTAAGNTFDFVGEHPLYEYQGYGPYQLGNAATGSPVNATVSAHPVDFSDDQDQSWEQPLYRYDATGATAPVYSGFNRRVRYVYSGLHVSLLEFDSIPWAVGSGTVGVAAKWIAEQFGLTVSCPYCQAAIRTASAATFLNNAIKYDYQLTIDLVDKRTYYCPTSGCSQPPGLYPDPTSGLLR